LDRVFVLGPRLFPQIDQRSTHVRILHSQRAVQVPRVRNPALTSARFVRGKAVFEQWIVKSLHLPGDDAVLYMDLPGTAARAVHTVRRADDFVVLPAVAIKLLPAAQLGINLVPDPRDRVSRFHHSPRLSL